MYQFLDIVLTLTHVALIGFNLLGWIWTRTRRAHLWCVGLTAFSWLVLGIWYGWGYCFITDWQWDVKRRLGETDLPASYIKYGIDKLTGIDVDPVLVDTATAVCFVLVTLLSLFFAVRRRYFRSQQAKSS